MSERHSFRLHVEVDPELAKKLDEATRMSDGVLDRARAAELAMQLADEVSFKGCGHCGGIWLDNRSAARLFDSLPPTAVELAQRATDATTGTAATDAELCCPICDRAMARQQPEAVALHLDVCAQHGTWFDGGELVRTLDALLARQAKKAELEHTLSDAALEAELGQLDDLYQSAYAEGLGHRLLHW